MHIIRTDTRFPEHEPYSPFILRQAHDIPFDEFREDLFPLEEDAKETLSYYDFPSQHGRFLRTNNPPGSFGNSLSVWLIDYRIVGLLNEKVRKIVDTIFSSGAPLKNQ